MAFNDGASSGDLTSSGVVPGQDADSTAELARLYASWRHQDADIEDLKGELRVSRRGAATLEAENAALRAELTAFRRAEWHARPREAARPGATWAASREIAVRNGGPDDRVSGKR